MEQGGFGARVPYGGTGSAEFRYLETAELVTRQFMRGSAWGWKTYHADLSTDYLPYPDEALHTFLGFASPATPGVSTAGRENAKRMLKRAYSLMDVYLEQLESFVANDSNARLFVTGEHGMRPAWMSFRPNVVLAQAGLLATDTAGTINLRRTRAAATFGGWVTINRATRKSGVVPADSVEPILARAEPRCSRCATAVESRSSRECSARIPPRATRWGSGGRVAGSLLVAGAGVLLVSRGDGPGDRPVAVSTGRARVPVDRS